jgi:hypothetical protein
MKMAIKFSIMAALLAVVSSVAIDTDASPEKVQACVEVAKTAIALANCNQYSDSVSVDLIRACGTDTILPGSLSACLYISSRNTITPEKVLACSRATTARRSWSHCLLKAPNLSTEMIDGCGKVSMHPWSFDSCIGWDDGDPLLIRMANE